MLERTHSNLFVVPFWNPVIPVWCWHTIDILVVPYRLPAVTVLNASVVTPGEREDAERFFVRYYIECPENELPKRYQQKHTSDHMYMYMISSPELV